jgi:hypothetical protein
MQTVTKTNLPATPNQNSTKAKNARSLSESSTNYMKESPLEPEPLSQSKESMPAKKTESSQTFIPKYISK